jgi:mRNA interferase MazF
MSTRSGVVNPARGEIWEVNLNPTVGREQSGRRPVLIVSDNELNSGPRRLVVVIPVTGTSRGFADPTPRSFPPEGGLAKPSVIMVEQVRSVSKDRFGHHGVVRQATMDQVDQILRIVLRL